MPTGYVTNLASTPTELPGGQMLRPHGDPDDNDKGEIIVTEENADEVRALVDSGRIAFEEQQLEGDDLKRRASELDIPNRSKMSAPELREAISQREAELQAAETQGDPDEGAE